MTIKRKSGPAREHSLAELRQINIRTMENHQRLNEIIDLRQQELGKMRDSLYVEVQNFREAHQAELRRSVEVAMDLATRSLPWWKRTVLAIRQRTEELIPHIAELVRKEAERVKAEVEAANAKEQAEQAAAKAQLEKDQAILAATKAANIDAANEKLDKAGAKMQMIDDGFGGVVKDASLGKDGGLGKAYPVQKTPNADEYEVDGSLVTDPDAIEAAPTVYDKLRDGVEPVAENEKLTPVDLNG